MPDFPPDKEDSGNERQSDAGSQPGSIEYDPLYLRAVSLLQEGQWLEAANDLAALDRRYPDSPALQRARELLALRLSAEGTWGAAAQAKRPAPSLRPMLKAPTVRVLLIANIVLYALVIVLWLLSSLHPLP